MPKRPPREVIRCGAYRLRDPRAEKIGTVEAPDAAQAMQRAAKEFELSDADRLRLSVMREP